MDNKIEGLLRRAVAELDARSMKVREARKVWRSQVESSYMGYRCHHIYGISSDRDEAWHIAGKEMFGRDIESGVVDEQFIYCPRCGIKLDTP